MVVPMRQFPPFFLHRHIPRTLPRLLTALTAGLILALALAPGAWAGKKGPARQPESAKQAAGPSPEACPPAGTPGASGQPPQKVLIVGDSFAVGLGLTMEQSLRTAGPVVLASRGKTSTGLESPHFYDWEKALADFLIAEKPDILLVMLGGNDAKNGRGTPQWSHDFEAKAHRFLEIAGRHKVRVYWVGLPPMREKSFSQRAWTANEAMRAACATATSCRFIDSWDLFADKSGNFCAKKTLAGKAVALRGKDGVHFTAAGCKLLTDHIATGMTTAR
uniref:Uncharacterized protein n=1 Tax=Desulfovibrio sp. U5L TaxID=596152 RepID=I2Q1Z6_9BACT